MIGLFFVFLALLCFVLHDGLIYVFCGSTLVEYTELVKEGSGLV